MHRSTILLSLSLAFASSPALAQTGATVWSGISAQVRAAHVAVARDQTEWESLWRNWVGTAPPRGLPPGSQGVAVFIGPKHTGGYGVEVRGVEQRDCLDVVTFVEHAPSPGAFVPQVFTTPWTVALLPASERPVAFERHSSTADTRLLLPTPEGPRLMQMSEICRKDRRP